MTFDEPDQEERIKNLRAEVKKLIGDERMFLLDNLPPNLSADVEERFLQNVIRYHEREPISVIELLANAGYEFVSSHKLDDKTLAVRLKEVIERISNYGVYVLQTNHLSDRELYEFLSKCLAEEVELFPEDPGSAYIINLIGDTAKDLQTYLKYYATRFERKQFARQFNVPVPEHKDPPFDRDRFLPKAPQPQGGIVKFRLGSS